MEYQGIDNVESIAQENDWLDVNYTAKKYLEEQPIVTKQNRKKVRPKSNRVNINIWRKMGAFGKVMACSVMAILALVAFMFVDSSGQSDVFSAVKQTFTTTFGFLGGGQSVNNSNTIELPINVTIDNVENGIITFSGGQALVSFTEGTVSNVTEDSVSVTMADGSVIVYSGCTEIFVKVGDSVEQYNLLARYKDSATACIQVDGVTVTEVVGSQNSIQWSV